MANSQQSRSVLFAWARTQGRLSRSQLPRRPAGVSTPSALALAAQRRANAGNSPGARRRLERLGRASHGLTACAFRWSGAGTALRSHGRPPHRRQSEPHSPPSSYPPRTANADGCAWEGTRSGTCLAPCFLACVSCVRAGFHLFCHILVQNCAHLSCLGYLYHLGVSE